MSMNSGFPPGGGDRSGLSPPYVHPVNRWQAYGSSGQVEPYVQQDNQPIYVPQVQNPFPTNVLPSGQVIYSNTPFEQGQGQGAVAPSVAAAGVGGAGNVDTMQYTGKGSRFLYSIDDGPNSDYIQCYYRSDEMGQPNIVELCEKFQQDCCDEGCCPKDQFWMGGVYVLIAVVIVVAIIGFAIVIVCFMRSRAKSRRDEDYMYDRRSQYGGSQVGVGYPYGPYGSSLGPPSHKY